MTMKRMFCLVFALHIVCEAHSGEVFTIANLSKRAAEIVSFEHGTMRNVQLFVNERDDISRREVPKSGGFHPTIFPEEALLLECSYITGTGKCVWPSCRIMIDGKSCDYSLKPDSQIALKITDSFTATKVEVVQVVMGSEIANFPPAIERGLRFSDHVLFVEGRGTEVVLDFLSQFSCYYSPRLVKQLQESLRKFGTK
jgi:hypothetical protein